LFDKKSDVTVAIRCPNCDKRFKTERRKNVGCPHCKAVGDVPKKEFERLMAEKSKKKKVKWDWKLWKH